MKLKTVLKHAAAISLVLAIAMTGIGCGKGSDAASATTDNTESDAGSNTETADQAAPENTDDKKGGVTITVGLKASHVEISNINTYKDAWEKETAGLSGSPPPVRPVLPPKTYQPAAPVSL